MLLTPLIMQHASRLGLGLVLGAVALVGGWVFHAAAVTRHEREVTARVDARWRAEIAAENERTRAIIDAAAREAEARDRAARDEADALRSRLTELEKENAQLPGGDDLCLDADRLRLLDGIGRRPR